MRTLVNFHVGSYKSTKEAINVTLGLRHIFWKHPPGWNTWEQLWRSSRNCAGEENGGVKSFSSETARGSWWKYKLVDGNWWTLCVRVGWGETRWKQGQIKKGLLYLRWFGGMEYLDQGLMDQFDNIGAD